MAELSHHPSSESWSPGGGRDGGERGDGGEGGRRGREGREGGKKRKVSYRHTQGHAH